MVQSVWPLRKSTPTLIPPPPLSPFEILPQLIVYGGKEAIKVFTFKPKVQKFKSIGFPTQAFLSSGLLLLGEHLGKDEIVSLLPAALHPQSPGLLENVSYPTLHLVLLMLYKVLIATKIETHLLAQSGIE